MASLFSALTVAVGGLGAQSAALGNISDDLSNAQTVGFKAIGTNFESLVTSSSATDNEPGGVRSTPAYANDVQGNLIQSDTATSLAISGQGFFQVTTATQSATGQTNFTNDAYYTREGDFTLDQNGFLVNSSGYYLLGNAIETDGNPSPTATPIEVSADLNQPFATSSSSYDANLPSSAANGFVSTPSTVLVYDGQGNTHDMTFTWTKVSANKWDLSVDIDKGKSVIGSSNYTATIPFTFNSASNVGTIQSIGSGTDNYSFTTTGAAQVDISGLSFPGLSGSDQGITLNFGDFNSSTGLTQFAGSDVSVTSFSQNGLPEGSFSNLSIDDSGNVTINYSNGSTRTIAQVQLAQFYAQDQLQRVTGNAYQATITSGDARVGVAGADGAGTIAAGSLESSNVDIATEFTDMIEAQQVYSANAKTITTVDQMLTTIINAVQ